MASSLLYLCILVFISNILQCTAQHVIDCSWSNACYGQARTCLDGQDCLIQCSGGNGCSTAQFYCPQNGNCQVICDRTDSCNSIQIYGENSTGLEVTCSQTRSCQTSTIHCPTNGDCKIECSNGYSCQDSVISAVDERQLNVTCTADSSCRTASFNGGVSSELNILCGKSYACYRATFNALPSAWLRLLDCATDTYTCGGLNVFCPQNVAGEARCVIQGDNSLGGWSSDPIYFYAVNSWWDIDFQLSNKNDNFDNGAMYCTDRILTGDYSIWCNIQSCCSTSTCNCFECTTSWNTCQDPPTLSPTDSPSIQPSSSPTHNPSVAPTTSTPTTTSTTLSPTLPSPIPTIAPSQIPSQTPTTMPSNAPTKDPSRTPSASPTNMPSNTPTNVPSSTPSASPSNIPSSTPTNNPSSDPTIDPTSDPSMNPTSATPTTSPSNQPSATPTRHPTSSPTNEPTLQPSESPTMEPTTHPTKSPTPEPVQLVVEIDDETTTAPTRAYQFVTASSQLSTTEAPINKPADSFIDKARQSQWFDYIAIGIAIVAALCCLECCYYCCYKKRKKQKRHRYQSDEQDLQMTSTKTPQGLPVPPKRNVPKISLLPKDTERHYKNTTSHSVLSVSEIWTQGNTPNSNENIMPMDDTENEQETDHNNHTHELERMMTPIGNVIDEYNVRTADNDMEIPGDDEKYNDAKMTKRVPFDDPAQDEELLSPSQQARFVTLKSSPYYGGATAYGQSPFIRGKKKDTFMSEGGERRRRTKFTMSPLTMSEFQHETIGDIDLNEDDEDHGDSHDKKKLLTPFGGLDNLDLEDEDMNNKNVNDNDIITMDAPITFGGDIDEANFVTIGSNDDEIDTMQ